LRSFVRLVISIFKTNLHYTGNRAGDSMKPGIRTVHTSWYGKVALWGIVVSMAGSQSLQAEPAGQTATVSKTAAKKRNVLVFFVDDLRPELGCYGNTIIKSPNIDKLAVNSVVFTRAYCQQAVCAPSRASVLSGTRPDTTKITDLDHPLTTTSPHLTTLPQTFKANGYTTLSFGKIYHHPADDPEGWSIRPKDPKGSWVGGYFNPESIAAMRANTEVKKGEEPGVKGPATEASQVDDSATLEYQMASDAIKYLEQVKNQPFFMAIGFRKPHLPFVSPQKYWDMYRDVAIPRAVNPFTPEGMTEYTFAGDSGELRAYSDIPDRGPIIPAMADRLKLGYYAAVSFMDAQLGRVMSALEQSGQLDNTVIVLIGDHGWKLGEHDRWCKHSNTENDTNAPMIISTPETRGKQLVSASLVEFVDLFPTLCDLAGIPKPKQLEGISLVPVLAKPDTQVKSAAFSQYPRGSVTGYAMVDGRYRYIEWQDRQKKIMARELYDHASDPLENVNLAGNAAYAATQTQLSARLAAGWKAAIIE